MARPKSKVQPTLMARFAVVSFAAGLLEKLITNWTTISSYIGGGALMGTLAWFQDLPPLMWGLAFFAGLILIAIIRLINSLAYSRKAFAKYAEKQADSSSVNPLQKDFEDQQINLRDFYHPYNQSRNNLAFRNCELFGPSELFLTGQISFRTTCFFVECNAVIIKDKQPLAGAVRMKDVTFTDCHFFRVTILVTAQDARWLKAVIPFGGEALPIITDGKYGEI
jgi:hypothetical protein